MKNKLFKIIQAGLILAAIVVFAVPASADLTPNFWAQLEDNVLMTNTPTGLATAEIHVGACYIGTGTGTPCGGGGGGPFSDITGTPTEVAYFDLAGNGTSDSLFTRNPVTKNTTIAALVSGDGPFIGLNPGGLTSGWLTGGSTVRTGFQAQSNGNALMGDFTLANNKTLFTVNDGTRVITQSVTNTPGNIASSSVISDVGNTQTWDADTTDDIQDIIAQSQNIAGIGLIGNAIAHTNTNTGETADLIIGDLTAVGGRPFSANMGYSNAVGNIRHSFLADDTGAAMSHSDSVANTLGFMTTSPSGNLSTWIADTTGTIQTKLEQSQDILGLGAFSGSALTWADSSTQVNGIVGAIDGTASGLFPGSTILATQNLGTGASSSIATNYDNVLNVATVIANAGNGDFDSGFEFDDGRMVVRYRNQTTGLDSAFEADANSAVTRYTADGTNEYQAVLADGTFTLKNSTTGNEYMAIDLASGVYEIGDLDASGNDTKFIINDSAQTITNHVDGVFSVEDGAAGSIMYIDAANRQSVFGNVSTAAGIKMFIDETTGINIQAPDATVNVGANGFGNGTNLNINDTTSTATLTGNFLIEATAGGNQWLNVAPAAGVVQIGDLSSSSNGTTLTVNDSTQSIDATKPIKLKGYTVATLPTGAVGQTAYVTDALTPAFGATVVGGGAVIIPVFFNGTNWIVD